MYDPPLSLVPMTLTLILVPSLSGSLSGKSSTCRTRVQMLIRVPQSQEPRYRSSATTRRDPSLLVLKRFSQSNLRAKKKHDRGLYRSQYWGQAGLLPSLLPEVPLSPYRIPSSPWGLHVFPEYHCNLGSPKESLRSLWFPLSKRHPGESLWSPSIPVFTTVPIVPKRPWGISIPEVFSILATPWRVPVVPAAPQAVLPLAVPGYNRCEARSSPSQFSLPCPQARGSVGTGANPG